MKILVTGSSGFLGVRLCRHLGVRHEIIAPTHAQMDITSRCDVNEFICRAKPDAVIHCAAISSTGYSQQHPDESRQTNIDGTLNIAKACAATGAKLIYMSSDQVYGGVTLAGPLDEDTPLEPKGIYGQHKLEAENKVQQLLPEAVGLRLTWMYDDPASGLRMNQNVLTNLLNARLSHTPIKACVNEYRGMTDVWQVVHNLEPALNLPGGIYNFGSENRLNTYDTLLMLAQRTGTPAELIVADSSWQRNLSMSINKLRRFGIDFPQTV